MKKFFIYMASAAFMFAACNKAEIDAPVEDVNTPVETETITVDLNPMTKTSLDGMNTVWSNNDVVSVTVDGKNIGTLKLVEGSTFSGEVEAGHNGDAILNYPAGVTAVPTEQKAVENSFANGAALLEGTTTMDALRNGEGASLQNKTALLGFSPAVAGDVTIMLGDASYTVTGCESSKVYYACVAPTENVALSYTIADAPGTKSKESVTFKAGLMYQLNELQVLASSGWFLPGAHNSWDTTKTPLYEDGDYYVARNVNIAAGGFKFFHPTYDWKGVNASSIALGEWLKFNGTNDIKISSITGAYDIYMTKDGARFQVLAAGSATPSAPVLNTAKENYLYLNPSMWNVDGARFAAYFFGNGEKWVSMTDPDNDGIYEVEKQAGYTKVIFCRMNGGNTTNNWNNKWNQSGDLTIPTNGNNLFTPTKWDGATGNWTKVTEF